ncbi:MAG: hypothetical protein WCV68_00915 [Candidatus Paceibacterota bacterium]
MENPFGQTPISLQEATKEVRGKALAEIIADPANVESLGQFIDQLQIIVEERETDDKAFNLRLALEMNVTLAEFYAEAADQNPAWRESAYDSYYDAAAVANQSKEEAIYNDKYNELISRAKEFLN